jgi:hypothetical protein
MNDSHVKTFAVGAALVIVGLPTALGPPTILSPYPFLLLVPLFLFGRLAVVLPALLFWIWSPQLFAGESLVPKRSAALLGILTIATPAYFAAGFRYGIKYDGQLYVVGVAVLNVAALLILWIGLRRARSQPSFGASLAFHGLLFAWLAWCAFPNLGELP